MVNVQKLIEKRDIKGLIKALKHKKSIVRCNVLKALGILNDPSLIPYIIKSLDDPDTYTKIEAIKSLGKYGNPEALPALIPLLSKKIDIIIKFAVVETLGDIKDPSTRSILIDLIRQNQSSTSLIEIASVSLAKLNDSKTIPTLLNDLKNLKGNSEKNKIIRKNFSIAFGAIKDPIAIPYLLEFLKDPEEQVRIYATIALGEIGDKSTILKIIEMVNDSDRWVHLKAIETLGKFNDPYAESTLFKFLETSDLDTLKAVFHALTEMNDTDPFTIPKDSFQSNYQILMIYLEELFDKSRTRNQHFHTIDLIAKYNLYLSKAILYRALFSDDRFISWHAATLLGDIGESAIPFLETALNKGGAHDIDIAIQTQLSKIKGEEIKSYNIKEM